MYQVLSIDHDVHINAMLHDVVNFSCAINVASHVALGNRDAFMHVVLFL